jgi:hypothetical protein
MGFTTKDAKGTKEEVTTKVTWIANAVPAPTSLRRESGHAFLPRVAGEDEGGGLNGDREAIG